MTNQEILWRHFNILNTPQEMAEYSTDNGHLQAFYLQLLQIKDADGRKTLSKFFWSAVNALPIDEKAAIKAAQSQIAHRLYDRMGSIVVELGKLTTKKELVLQDCPLSIFHKKGFVK